MVVTSQTTSRFVAPSMPIARSRRHALPMGREPESPFAVEQPDGEYCLPIAELFAGAPLDLSVFFRATSSDNHELHLPSAVFDAGRAAIDIDRLWSVAKRLCFRPPRSLMPDFIETVLDNVGYRVRNEQPAIIQLAKQARTPEIEGGLSSLQWISQRMTELASSEDLKNILMWVFYDLFWHVYLLTLARINRGIEDYVAAFEQINQALYTVVDDSAHRIQSSEGHLDIAVSIARGDSDSRASRAALRP